MKTEDRLRKLEVKINPPKPHKIFVHFEGRDYFSSNGEKFSLEEFEALKSDDDVLLEVRYSSEVKE
jgi:hypothetical protein